MIDPTDKSNNILLYKQLMMLLKQKNLTYALNSKHNYHQLESVIALIDSVLRQHPELTEVNGATLCDPTDSPATPRFKAKTENTY